MTTHSPNSTGTCLAPNRRIPFAGDLAEKRRKSQPRQERGRRRDGEDSEDVKQHFDIHIALFVFSVSPVIRANPRFPRQPRYQSIELSSSGNSQVFARTGSK
jgi:hypothetical protein